MRIRFVDRMIAKIRKRRARVRDARKIREIIENSSVVKLNLGCGSDIKSGWVNIDNDYYRQSLSKLDFNWDLTKGLPFPDNSVDYMFNEHFLEHLTYNEALMLLKDCRRALKDGGVMRIAMPDLEKCVNDYLLEDWRAPLKLLMREVEERGDPEGKSWAMKYIARFKTRAQLINNAFREADGSHKWLYDFEEVSRLSREAGYSKIARCENSKSEHAELNNLERNKYLSTLIVEMVK